MLLGGRSVIVSITKRFALIRGLGIQNHVAGENRDVRVTLSRQLVLVSAGRVVTGWV